MNNIFNCTAPILLKKVIIWDDNNGFKVQQFYFNDNFLNINDLNKFIKNKFVFWHKQNFKVYAEYLINNNNFSLTSI